MKFCLWQALDCSPRCPLYSYTLQICRKNADSAKNRFSNILKSLYLKIQASKPNKSYHFLIVLFKGYLADQSKSLRNAYKNVDVSNKIPQKRNFESKNRHILGSNCRNQTNNPIFFVNSSELNLNIMSEYHAIFSDLANMEISNLYKIWKLLLLLSSNLVEPKTSKISPQLMDYLHFTSWEANLGFINCYINSSCFQFYTAVISINTSLSQYFGMKILLQSCEKRIVN